MARELVNWIESYLEFTSGSEPPTSYHNWLGASVVAGALQRKVRLKWGFETIYPNLFLILVGHSGRTRKGIALGIAKDLILRVPDISVSPESGTRESLILAMKRGLRNFENPTTQEMVMHCSLTAFSEELAVLLGQSDVKLLANLTDWYDSKDSWAYETVGRGRDELQGLCFNLAGATAPDWLQSMLPQEAVGGGFTARVIFVVEERKRATVPKHVLSKEEEELRERLVRDLERINQLKGDIAFSPDGDKTYTDWYTVQDKLLSEGKPPIEDVRFAAYCERRATHLRKLMIIMSASRGDDMLIRRADFDAALKLMTAAERKMHKTFGGLGTAPHSDVAEKIFNYIRAMGASTRSTVMARFYRDVDPDTMRVIEETGEQMKVISIKLLPDQKDKLYQWIAKDSKDASH